MFCLYSCIYLRHPATFCDILRHSQCLPYSACRELQDSLCKWRPQVEEAGLLFFGKIFFFRLSTRVNSDDDLFRLVRDFFLFLCLAVFFVIFSLLLAVFGFFFVEESILESPQILSQERKFVLDLESSHQFSFFQLRKSRLPSFRRENGSFARLADESFTMTLETLFERFKILLIIRKIYIIAKFQLSHTVLVIQWHRQKIIMTVLKMLSGTKSP